MGKLFQRLSSFQRPLMMAWCIVLLFNRFEAVISYTSRIQKELITSFKTPHFTEEDLDI